MLGQTYKDLELWVIDDCSTDRTVEILNEISDPRLHVYRLEHNSGACVARNTGITLSHGDYIAFQDSDDAWRTDKLEEQLHVIETTDADVVFCKMKRHLEGNAAYRFAEDEVPNLSEGFTPNIELLRSSKVSTQMMLCKREVFDEIRFDPEMPRMQDYDVVIQLCQKYRFYFVNKVLVDLYLQDDSLTTNEHKMIAAYNRLLDKHARVWRAYPDIYEDHYNGLAQYQLRNGMNAYGTYMSAYNINHNIKYLVKAAAAMAGLMVIYYKRRNH